MASSRGSKRVCAMACCPNPRDAQYFAFPQKKLMLQRLWISVSNDFERNLQAELLDLKARKKLKSDAVPSLHIPFASPSSDEPKSSRDIRKETRERKELVKQLLEASKVQETSMDSETKTDNEGSIEICSGINESQQEPSTKTQSTQIDVYKFEKGVQCEEGSWPLFWERKCKKLQKELSLTKKELCRYKTKCKLLNSKKFKQNLIRTSLEKSHSKIQAHLEESIFLRKSPEGRWRLLHNAIPTLFEHIKVKNKQKLPFNRNRDAEELQRNQRILMLEHSYAKTRGASKKEDYLDHEI